MAASAALIVFAKLPAAGQAKTRLVPALGAEGAARLARRMLQHAVAEGSKAGCEHVELCFTPDEADPASASVVLPPGIALARQGPGDLGARMHRALARVLATHPRALLIGTDAPAIDASLIRRAASNLDRHDAVFLPALDGGYVLVGLRRPAPELFLDMAWSTPDVMAQTRMRAHQAAMTIVELEAVADVDRPEDLVHVPAHWLADATTPP